jgi:hypothetical protein
MICHMTLGSQKRRQPYLKKALREFSATRFPGKAAWKTPTPVLSRVHLASD